LAGHAAFETYAVLTRLPPPLRFSPVEAREVLSLAFPVTCSLDEQATTALWADLAGLDVVGGSTFDALVAAAAMTNGRRLLTRDKRAERTYRAVGVDYQFID
jgi:predicted nucleic acid-binding protein